MIGNLQNQHDQNLKENLIALKEKFDQKKAQFKSNFDLQNNELESKQKEIEDLYSKLSSIQT